MKLMKLGMLALCALTMGVFAGCGKSDEKKAEEATAFVQGLVDKAKAGEITVDYLASLADELPADEKARYEGMSEDDKKDFDAQAKENLPQAFTFVDITVGAGKVDGNGVLVPVTIKPTFVAKQAINAFAANLFDVISLDEVTLSVKVVRKSGKCKFAVSEINKLVETIKADNGKLEEKFMKGAMEIFSAPKTAETLTADSGTPEATLVELINKAKAGTLDFDYVVSLADEIPAEFAQMLANVSDAEKEEFAEMANPQVSGALNFIDLTVGEAKVNGDSAMVPVTIAPSAATKKLYADVTDGYNAVNVDSITISLKLVKKGTEWKLAYSEVVGAATTINRQIDNAFRNLFE